MNKLGQLAQPIPASSILLIRDSPLEVLMVRRRANGTFSSALVFPGGVVDPGDSSEHWFTLVEDAHTLDSSERSFRIAACRELFEETNILLCEGGPLETYSKDSSYFDSLTRADKRISLEKLIPFGHWITPAGVAKRFDTRFYLCAAPNKAIAICDGREIVDAHWARPEDIVASVRRGERRIMVPTLFNLIRLAESRDANSAIVAARNRPVLAVLPKLERRGDSTFVVIPHEAGYGITEHVAYGI
jgi:8-oxo-dGTP pyrophosphatase MutT (NUDIX family)